MINSIIKINSTLELNQPGDPGVKLVKCGQIGVIISKCNYVCENLTNNYYAAYNVLLDGCIVVVADTYFNVIE